MKRALIVEDCVSDLRQASALLKKYGVEEAEAITRVDKALLRLQEVVENKRPAPDLIVLDLNFNLESGFEVLRFMKSHQQLKDIRVVVWTVMGETQQQICRFFGADVVPKSEGIAALSRTIEGFSATAAE